MEGIPVNFFLDKAKFRNYVQQRLSQAGTSFLQNRLTELWNNMVIMDTAIVSIRSSLSGMLFTTIETLELYQHALDAFALNLDQQDTYGQAAFQFYEMVLAQNVRRLHESIAERNQLPLVLLDNVLDFGLSQEWQVGWPHQNLPLNNYVWAPPNYNYQSPEGGTVYMTYAPPPYPGIGSVNVHPPQSGSAAPPAFSFPQHPNPGFSSQSATNSGAEPQHVYPTNSAGTVYMADAPPPYPGIGSVNGYPPQSGAAAPPAYAPPQYPNAEYASQPASNPGYAPQQTYPTNPGYSNQNIGFGNANSVYPPADPSQYADGIADANLNGEQISVPALSPFTRSESRGPQED